MEDTNKDSIEYVDLQNSEVRYYRKLLGTIQKKLELIKTENDNDEKIVRAIGALTKSLKERNNSEPQESTTVQLSCNID